jgi:molecular chaperone GrpE
MKKKEEQNDDIVFEEEVENLAPDFNKKLKKVKEELKKCQKEKEEYLNGWQRSKADFVNFKKRAEEDKKILRKYANEDLVLSILPTLDNFEAALKDHGESEEIKKWKVGFEHVYNQLKKTLESIGVEELNPVGEMFAPTEHEAVEEIKTEDKKQDHKVAEVVMKGYKMGDKILRAPQVKVWVLE